MAVLLDYVRDVCRLQCNVYWWLLWNQNAMRSLCHMSSDIRLPYKIKHHHFCSSPKGVLFLQSTLGKLPKFDTQRNSHNVTDPRAVRTGIKRTLLRKEEVMEEHERKGSTLSAKKGKGAQFLILYTNAQKQMRKEVSGRQRQWGMAERRNRPAPRAFTGPTSGSAEKWLALSNFTETHALAILIQVFKMFEINFLS